MEERLQKIIARAGIASRRHAEQLILSGAVTVNGHVVTTLGSKADAQRDHITVGPRVVRFDREAQPLYFAFYKPPQVVCTLNDPEGRPCLGPYIRGAAAKGRLFPVGRLEFDASGLLLLTSDGALASDLMRTAATIPQVWRFKVRGRIPEDKRHEIERDARVHLRVQREGDNPWYEAEVSNAPRDAVRQTLFRHGFMVEKAVRSGFAAIELGNLPPGEMRELTPEELRSLRRAAQGHLGPAVSKATPPTVAERKRGGREQRRHAAPHRRGPRDSSQRDERPGFRGGRPYRDGGSFRNDRREGQGFKRRDGGPQVGRPFRPNPSPSRSGQGRPFRPDRPAAPEKQGRPSRPASAGGPKKFGRPPRPQRFDGGPKSGRFKPPGNGPKKKPGQPGKPQARRPYREGKPRT